MADMMRKGLASQMSQEVVETSQPLLPAQSTDSSSNVHLDQQQVEEGVVIDIEKWKQDNQRCIYRVPRMIRKLNEDAYTPMAVSIGPFHYDDKRLRDMESYKQILFKRFKEKAGESLDKMATIVKNAEQEIRASYSENIEVCSAVLTQLVLVDAVFIIELFTSFYNNEICNDSKLSQQYLFDIIGNDLLLLENQLPFFLIEQLFDTAFPQDQRGGLPSFLYLTFHFFAYLNKQELEADPNEKIKHFTDLLRLFYLPRVKPGRKDAGSRDLLSYSANELLEAGVKFKPISQHNCCLLDLNFSGHVLKIPEVFVDDNTEFLFRNMIALEHCHYPSDSYIVDYAFLMDCLISTNKDVDVLVHKKIIHNWLGDTNEVATLFNGLVKNINSSTFSSKYLDICRGLNKFYENWWHKMKATVRRDYCNTPWKTVGTIVGIIVLILTTTLTIHSLVQAILT